jgi:hypothetical protein
VGAKPRLGYCFSLLILSLLLFWFTCPSSARILLRCLVHVAMIVRSVIMSFLLSLISLASA